MLKDTLTEDQFIRYMEDDNNSSFSRKALIKIFEYYEELEEDVEFYPVDIRTNFAEYTIKEFNEEHETNYKTVDEVGEDYYIIPMYDEGDEYEDKFLLVGEY